MVISVADYLASAKFPCTTGQFGKAIDRRRTTALGCCLLYRKLLRISCRSWISRQLVCRNLANNATPSSRLALTSFSDIFTLVGMAKAHYRTQKAATMEKDRVKCMSKVVLAGCEAGWKAADTSERRMRALSILVFKRTSGISPYILEIQRVVDAELPETVVWTSIAPELPRPIRAKYVFWSRVSSPGRQRALSRTDLYRSKLHQASRRATS